MIVETAHIACLGSKSVAPAAMLGGSWPRQTPSDKEVARSVSGVYEIRDDVIWPGDLSLPARPPKLVYLDMLGWINLAEVAAGNAAPAGYDRLLEACRQAWAERRALFPLSSTTALELYNIWDGKRRKARVAVMDQLSGFNYLLGRPQIQQLEVEAALNEIPGVTITPQGPLSLVGPSLLWSFGMRGGLVTNVPDPDAAAKQICDGMGIDPGDDAWTSLERWAERELLTGPENHDDPDLVKAGYNLDKWRDTLQKRAQQEQQLATALDADPKMRKGRLRDVVNCNEMCTELIDMVTKMTMAMGTSIGALLDNDRGKLRDFSDGMPSTRVAASLKTIYHKNRQHVWTSRDINDIDALSIAVPYCDCVFTDKAVRDKVISCRELDIFQTEMPRNPEELAEWLDGLPAPAADT
jgi:hypothetical protein